MENDRPLLDVKEQSLEISIVAFQTFLA